MAKEQKAKVKIPAVPAKIGAAINALFKLRQHRKQLEQAASLSKDVESGFEEAILKKFKKSDLEGARGTLAQATITRTEHATIEDFGKLWAWIKKHNAQDVLQRRVSGPAVRERWAKGVAIPGVGKFTDVRLTLTKLR